MSESGGDEQSTAGRAVLIGGLITGAMALFTSPVALLIGGAFLVVIGALYVLLLPLIMLIAFFNGLFGGGGGDEPSFDVRDAAARSIEAGRGDGKGALDRSQVPAGLRDTVADAGSTCTQIGPVVIAAQVQVASGWYAAKVGENGEVGISQLRPEIFEKYGEDTDDNDSTSAKDPEDSIMAQAAYMCELAEEVQALLDDGQAIGDPLDLTLAAYREGLDAVRTAGGVTRTADTRAYIGQVRSYFGQYLGLFGEPPVPPTTASPGPGPRVPTPADD